MPEPVQIEVEETKKPIDTPSDVAIEFNEKNEPIKKEEAKKPEPSLITPEILANQKIEIEKKLNSHFYSQRKKDEEIERQLKEIAQRLQGAIVPKQAGPETEVWDKKVQSNWKGTVEELADARAEVKFKELMAAQDAQRRAIDNEQRIATLRQENIKKVLGRYPDLDDNTSEKAQIYRGILDKNQHYLSDPSGPILAMRDMEDELRDQGKLLDIATQRIVEKEVVRQARAAASQAPAGTKAKSNVIVLTKEEKEFCDNNNLKYESYARSKRMIGQKEGVEA